MTARHCFLSLLFFLLLSVFCAFFVLFFPNFSCYVSYPKSQCFLPNPCISILPLCNTFEVCQPHYVILESIQKRYLCHEFLLQHKVLFLLFGWVCRCSSGLCWDLHKLWSIKAADALLRGERGISEPCQGTAEALWCSLQIVKNNQKWTPLFLREGESRID